MLECASQEGRFICYDGLFMFAIGLDERTPCGCVFTCEMGNGSQSLKATPVLFVAEWAIVAGDTHLLLLPMWPQPVM